MIRTASDNDIQKIEALIKSVPGLWHNEWRSDAVERAIRASDGLASVWDEGGDITGFICAHDVGFLGYLSLLVVAEAARRTGIGKKLVRHTEQELSQRGCTVLISDVWKTSVGFYQELDWSPPDVVLLRHKLAGSQNKK